MRPRKEHPIPSLLIVDADQERLRERGDQLLMDGYEVDAAATMKAARIKLAQAPDALVLCTARMEPESIGLLRQLRAGQIARADAQLPVLVVGADDDSAAVRCYRAGADLALPTNSSPLLVAAGLETLVRRAAGEGEGRQMLRVGSLSVDCDARVAQVDERPVNLTRLEFDLLQTLASRPRKAFTRAELTREVWGYDPAAAGPSRTVDAHASRLRRNLERAGADQLVQNVRGVGWRLTL
jgi:DNA-binding response OmpR family regulator